jgi:hypothetical protein
MIRHWQKMKTPTLFYNISGPVSLNGTQLSALRITGMELDELPTITIFVLVEVARCSVASIPFHFRYDDVSPAETIF